MKVVIFSVHILSKIPNFSMLVSLPRFFVKSPLGASYWNCWVNIIPGHDHIYICMSFTTIIGAIFAPTALTNVIIVTNVRSSETSPTSFVCLFRNIQECDCVETVFLFHHNSIFAVACFLFVPRLSTMMVFCINVYDAR